MFPPDGRPSSMAAPLEKSEKPTFRAAFLFWLKLGFISFGGPTGQIAIMHAEVVERRRWVSEGKFLHALNFCMLLPGPEAQQLATYLGWSLHGTWGGIAAGSLFVLPSAVLLWLLSWLFMTHGQTPWLDPVIWGLQVAVVAIVASALVRIGGRALRHPFLWGMAGFAFVAFFFFRFPFVALIAAAAVIGAVGGRWRPDVFRAGGSHGPAADAEDEETGAPRSMGKTLRILAGGVMLWWAPIIGVGWWAGWDSVWFRMGVFFSQAALVTFGGAYAVLPYVAQQAVEHYGWLSTEQMMAGLALAETTPGPLIMVLQFVGFVGGWQQAGPLPPLLAATLAAALTTWATFLPSFIFILAGAPYVDLLRKQPILSSMLTAITAVVVGVILNLAVWFAAHVFMPQPGEWDGLAMILAAGLFVGMQRLKWPVVAIVIAGALAGVGRGFLG
jgi:chromate transporter